MLISFQTQIPPSSTSLLIIYINSIDNGHARRNGPQYDNHQMHLKLQDIKGK